MGWDSTCVDAFLQSLIRFSRTVKWYDEWEATFNLYEVYKYMRDELGSKYDYDYMEAQFENVKSRHDTFNWILQQPIVLHDIMSNRMFVPSEVRESSTTVSWVFNAVYESWHNTPHLKRGEELEIKFITVASEDTTNEIKYPSFHPMKLQRPDKKAFTYIKEQETKPAHVVNLTEDEISTRRGWGVWVCLTEMDKVKYPFKIYQNLVNGSFLLNAMTGATIRFANDTFEQKKAMIWENMLIGTENTRRKTCNMMHVGRWHEHICKFCATQEKSLFGRNILTPTNKGAGPKEKAAESPGYHTSTIQESKEMEKQVSRIWNHSTKALDTR
ncbi:hypothetical protein ACS0TY_026391 [Phlomoides rotata]